MQSPSMKVALFEVDAPDAQILDSGFRDHVKGLKANQNDDNRYDLKRAAVLGVFVSVASVFLTWGGYQLLIAQPLPVPSAYMTNLLAELKEANPDWRYAAYDRFAEATPADLLELVGGSSGSHKLEPRTSGRRLDDHPAEWPTGPLPPAFDSRSRWPECMATLWHIRDQSQCGSCWAFGSTTAFNDRVCIASQGKVTALLSPTETMSCCDPEHGCPDSHGCKGGEASDAFKYFRDFGLVTGGDVDDLGKDDSCWPYELKTYPKHTGKHNETTPQCRSTCLNQNYPIPFAQDAHFAKVAYRLESVEEVKRDIMAFGPVACSYDVYADFMAYKGGVYRHTRGKLLDGHVVRVLGWAEDEKGEYWIAANSWNTKWGEDGYFRIGFGEGNIVSNTSCIAGEARA